MALATRCSKGLPAESKALDVPVGDEPAAAIMADVCLKGGTFMVDDGWQRCVARTGEGNLQLCCLLCLFVFGLARARSSPRSRRFPLADFSARGRRDLGLGEGCRSWSRGRYRVSLCHCKTIHVLDHYHTSQRPHPRGTQRSVQNSSPAAIAHVPS